MLLKIGEWDGGTGIDWGSESASATTNEKLIIREISAHHLMILLLLVIVIATRTGKLGQFRSRELL